MTKTHWLPLLFLMMFPSVFAQTERQRGFSPNQLVNRRVEFGVPRNWTINELGGARGATGTIADDARVRFAGTVRIGTDGERGYLLTLPSQPGRQFWVRAEDSILNEVFPNCSKLNEAQSNAAEIESTARRDRDNPAFQALEGRWSPNGNMWASVCNNFISADGRIGQWGMEFLNAAESVTHNGNTGLDYLMQDYLWQRICPGFTEFSAQKKRHFLAYFIATKAMDEATCNPRAYADRSDLPDMPNPPGLGFFMLEGSASLRASRDRRLGSGNYCQGEFGRGTTQGRNDLSLRLQFRCATSQIIREQFLENRPFGYSGGYWVQANSMSGDISENI